MLLSAYMYLLPPHTLLITLTNPLPLHYAVMLQVQATNHELLHNVETQRGASCTTALSPIAA